MGRCILTTQDARGAKQQAVREEHRKIDCVVGSQKEVNIERGDP